MEEHDGFPTSISFIALHGADKFLLDTVLDCYSTLREQVRLASESMPLPDANGDLDASELLKEKVSLSKHADFASFLKVLFCDFSFSLCATSQHTS